jgi:hypothetical protein
MVARPAKGLISPNFYKQLTQQLKSFYEEPTKGTSYRGDFLENMLNNTTKDLPILDDLNENNDYDVFGNPIIKKFEIPLLPDFITDFINDNRDYRENDEAWQIIHSFEGFYMDSKRKMSSKDLAMYKTAVKAGEIDEDQVSFTNFEASYKKMHGEYLKEEFLNLHKDGVQRATGEWVKGGDWELQDLYKAIDKAKRAATKKTKSEIIEYLK